MPHLTRWAAVAAIAAAGALATAGPAAAQYPGANGSRDYVTQDASGAKVWHGPGITLQPCLNDDDSGLEDVCVDQFTWSPNGQRALLLGQADSDSDFQPGLYTWDVGAQSSEGVPVLFDTVDRNTQISYSPDASQVAVTHKGDVWTLNATTGRLIKNLTPGLTSTVEKDPSWNPKGGTIAYSASDGIRTPSGRRGSAKLVAKGGIAPDYSPDGSKILFTNTSGKLAYVTLSSGKVTTTPITGAPGAKWSPDGKQVIFKGVNGCASATLTGTITWRVTDTTCSAVGWQPLH